MFTKNFLTPTSYIRIFKSGCSKTSTNSSLYHRANPILVLQISHQTKCELAWVSWCYSEVDLVFLIYNLGQIGQICFILIPSGHLCQIWRESFKFGTSPRYRLCRTWMDLYSKITLQRSLVFSSLWTVRQQRISGHSMKLPATETSEGKQAATGGRKM